MELRELTSTDAQTFRDFRFKGLVQEPTAFGSVQSEEMSLEAGRAALADRHNLVIVGAFEGDELVGVVGLMRERGKKYAHKAVIWGMYVATASRGRGIGKQLMTAALTAAQQMPGIEIVSLRVNAQNFAAASLYAGVGFIEYGRDVSAMRVDGRYYDELMMRLELGSVTPGRA